MNSVITEFLFILLWVLAPYAISWAAMNRSGFLFALILGVLFAVFTLLRFGADESDAIRFAIAVGIFGAYCGVVISGTSSKKRELSLGGQTFLGAFCGVAIAALFGANLEGYMASIIIGLGLGFTSDYWANHIQLP